MPPSTHGPATASAIARAVAGETAFASTNRRSNPVRERATASAAWGGQTERTMSLARASFSTERASRSPASSARRAVAALRSSDAQRTGTPRVRSAAPSAVPISPGCSSPTTRSGIRLHPNDRSVGEANRMDEQDFLQYVQSGGQVETTDWMPDEYRARLIKFIEMHGNSELMGVLPEREWILRAPTLQRKLALTAKVQDEVGHAQLIYRVVEDLGKPREQCLADLVSGKSKFHNVFHYPTC